jgi:hypothetical protein
MLQKFQCGQQNIRIHVFLCVFHIQGYFCNFNTCWKLWNSASLSFIFNLVFNYSQSIASFITNACVIAMVSIAVALLMPQVAAVATHKAT